MKKVKSIEKIKEEILEELDRLLTNPLKNMDIATLPGDCKRTIVAFLSTSLDKISAEAYKAGCEDTLRQTDPDHKACFQELEKAKLTWGDIGYKNGLFAAKDCVQNCTESCESGRTCDLKTLIAIDSLIEKPL